MTQNRAAGTANGTTTKKEEELKIVIVGDGGCGKTSLLMVYAKGDFPEVRMSCRLPHLLMLYSSISKGLHSKHSFHYLIKYMVAA